MRFPGGYQITPNDDAIYLYQDVPVAIMSEKGLNNGQPSFLTSLMSLGELQDGVSAVHIGTGTGYYTAVMSNLAGQNGRVVGIEFEPELASRARANLAQFSNIDAATKTSSSRRSVAWRATPMSAAAGMGRWFGACESEASSVGRKTSASIRSMRTGVC